MQWRTSERFGALGRAMVDSGRRSRERIKVQCAKQLEKWAEWDSASTEQLDLAVREWGHLSRETALYPVRMSAAVRRAWFDSVRHYLS